MLIERYGADLAVQVIPLAAPPSYLAAEDSAERRSHFGLPDRYVATTAGPGDFGRLEWLLDALAKDPTLPDVAVIAGSVPLERDEDHADAGRTANDPEHDAPSAAPDCVAAVVAAIPPAIASRVHVVHPRELADIGAALSGAELLAIPQSKLGAGYEVLGALAAGLPVLHSGCPCTSELTLDAGIAAEDADGFARELVRLTSDGAERGRLGVLAEDRSRGFTWAATAMALWELHANI